MSRIRFPIAVAAVLVAAVVAALQIPASASHSSSHPCDLIASTSGSDSNTGADLESPLRTAQALVDMLQAGQTGCLRGTSAATPFTEDVVIQQKNESGGGGSSRITLMSYPGEVAKIRGNLSVEDTANLITLRQLVLEGTSGGAAARIDGDDVMVSDSNITNAAAVCVRVGVIAPATRVALLRNRIHDCGTDAINLGRSTHASVLWNLLYDSSGYGVKFSADADQSYVYRNIVDANDHGIGFFGQSSLRYPDHNFVDSGIVSRSTQGWNVTFSQMPNSGENYLSQTCVFSATHPNGGLQTSTKVQGYQIWSPPLTVSDPAYRDRARKDFRPSNESDPCFAHSGDVATVVSQGGGANDEAASADNPRPNILFIITDDQRADGTMTQDVMPKTIAKLRDRGVNFANAYATTPLCCPARASIMTGQYAHNHEVTNGVWQEDLRHETTLQALLRAPGAGYRTGIFGKFLNGWPLGTDPPNWDKWSVLNDGYCPILVNENGTRMRYPALDPATGGPPVGECDEADLGRTSLAPYSTDYLRDRAVEFLEQGESDDATDTKPWFLYVAPFAPHPASTPEADYANESFPAFTDTPSTFEDVSDKPPWVAARQTSRANIFGNGTDPGRRLKQLRSLRSVDDMVGTLLDELEQKGEQDTLVVFMSDNGYLWGEHGLNEKGAPYITSAQVPLIVRYPPVTTPGKTDTRAVANIDLMPTALDAAGLPTRSDPPIDGQSLFGTTARQRLHTEYYNHDTGDVDWAATRAPGEYLYVETYAADGETVTFREYYDLVADPYETSNLYGPDGEAGGGDDTGTPQQTVAQLSDALRRDRMCEGTACPPGPGGGTADTRPPRTLVTAPSINSTVCCRVMLKADASDNVGTQRVEFRVDGNVVGTDTTFPYSTIWENSGLYAAGQHLIEAVAFDTSGNQTPSGSPGSAIGVTLDKNGFDIQIEDGGVPRTNCGKLPAPCNVGTINPGDKLIFTFPSGVAPGNLIPSWDGTEPATCAGDPPALGCVTVGIKADSQADSYDADTVGVYRDLAGTNRIAMLGDVDLNDFDYIAFDTGIPFRTWPRSPMKMMSQNKIAVVTLGQGTGSLGNGVATTVWTNPVCDCTVWESIDGAETGEDREF